VAQILCSFGKKVLKKPIIKYVFALSGASTGHIHHAYSSRVAAFSNPSPSALAEGEMRQWVMMTFCFTFPKD
jgi:hypothetical protein